jgi:putative hydrolase of the HAD superfamily
VTEWFIVNSILIIEDFMFIVKAVLFDFGGVIAEEGFTRGLEAMARKQGQDPDRFFIMARDLIYSTGYVLGLCNETTYWEALRQETGLQGEEGELHREILERFLVRLSMIRRVQDLKQKGFFVGILSDQTDWLDELDLKYHFFKYFDQVFNSYHLHKSKRDPAWFSEICAEIGFAPQEVLFIDDNGGNIKRAAGRGLRTIHFQDEDQFNQDLRQALCC